MDSNMDKIIKETTVPLYKRPSALDNIPDDFAARMMKSSGQGGALKVKPELQMPDGFTIAPAYNKGAYMIVPRSDTDAYTHRK